MTKMKQLQKKAIKSAEFRGHVLPEFTIHSWDSDIAYANCIKCDMQVVVDCSPAPNSIDIGGEAVAFTCEGG